MEVSQTKRVKSNRKGPRIALALEVDHDRLSEIYPSPENDRLYRPVDSDDPEIVALAESIRQHGVLEPLIVSADGFIVSGHRRYAAARRAGLQTVPCRRLSIRRADDLNAFLRLLREHNRQRDKSSAERLREELVSINPDDAYRKLCLYRRAQAAVDVPTLVMGAVRPRKAMSDAKLPLLRAIETIIYERSRFWPLSDRQIHYALLNAPPLIHASKPDSRYQNDVKSYRANVDILTRARLDGSIPFEAIGDETRPVQVWDVHPNPRAFLRRELDGLFLGYWRDLMQSQPNHIELLGEKNTIKPILEPPATEYTLPLTIGRGFCSLPPRHAMAERFKASGKEKLVLLIVSDFDPEGESIAESFARSMRDDFGVDAVHAIKVALTAEQVAEHELPPMLTAKATSSRFKKFVAKHGHDVFELEALAPEVLQEIVRAAIERVIDGDAYAEEIEAERQDAAFVENARRQVLVALKGIDLE